MEPLLNENKLLIVLTSPDDEVIVDGRGHLEPPVVVEMQHAGRVSLLPMFPAVCLNVAVMFLTIYVAVLSGGRADPVCVEVGEEWGAVGDVQQLDGLVEPHNFFQLVFILWRLLTIVREPSKLWWIHQGCNCHCVGSLLVKLSGALLQNHFGELLKTGYNEVTTIIMYKVVVASDQDHVQGFGVMLEHIVKLECKD